MPKGGYTLPTKYTGASSRVDSRWHHLPPPLSLAQYQSVVDAEEYTHTHTHSGETSNIVQTVCIYMVAFYDLDALHPSRTHDGEESQRGTRTTRRRDDAEQAVGAPRDRCMLKGLEEVERRVCAVGHVLQVVDPGGCRRGRGRRLERRRRGRLVERQRSVGQRRVRVRRGRAAVVPTLV